MRKKTLNMMKLIISMLISITLITKIYAMKVHLDNPQEATQKTTTVNTTQRALSVNKSSSTTSAISTTTHSSVGQNTRNNPTDENHLNRMNQNNQNNKTNDLVEIISPKGNTTGSAEAYRSGPSKNEEATPTTSLVWTSITIGVLGVLGIIFYVFWYRKRAAFYSFKPKTTTQR